MVRVAVQARALPLLEQLEAALVAPLARMPLRFERAVTGRAWWQLPEAEHIAEWPTP
jgi:hypothetical protein